MGLKFNEMFPSRFFKADDLPQPLAVKIKEVHMEKLGDQNGDEKPVLYFVGLDKALALNKTNASAIITIAGSDDTDNWIGCKIELYRDRVMFRGQRTAGIRVRPHTDNKSTPDGPTPAEPTRWEKEIPDPSEPLLG